MKEMVVGNIRALDALATLHEQLIDKQMWEEEYYKKDYECECLRERLQKLQDLVDKLGIKSQKKIIKKINRRNK